MSHETEHMARLEAASRELEDAQIALSTKQSKHAAAKRARANAAATATTKQLRTLREADEDAADEVAVAQRAHDTAKQRVIDLDAELPHAIDADDRERVHTVLADLRPLAREFIKNQKRNEEIFESEIAPLWDRYMEVVRSLRAGPPVQNKHGLVVNVELPATVDELIDSTRILDGEDVMSLWERSPAGRLAADAERRLRAAPPGISPRSDSPPLPEPDATEIGWTPGPPPRRMNHVTDNPAYEYVEKDEVSR